MKTNTKIYTEEFVLKEMTLLLETLKENEDIVYLGELFINKNYTRNRFAEWVKEYKDNIDIQRISGTIKEILETRAVKGAMTNKLNSTFTIFHLKNNFDWKDRSEIDNNVKGEMKLETNLSENQMKLIANRILENDKGVS